MTCRWACNGAAFPRPVVRLSLVAEDDFDNCRRLTASKMKRVMPFDIIVADEPPPSDREAILGALRAYNEMRGGPANARTIGVLLRDVPSGETIGGLWGRAAYDWLHIDLLFIPEQLRGGGLGTRLVRQAERIALEGGLIGVWVDTIEFQAPGFYQKLGYEVFGVLPDRPRGRQQFFLHKRLRQP
jgi:GNAT superfamily N-acetyltransferase